MFTDIGRDVDRHGDLIMPAPLVHAVVVPYWRFLTWQDRRRRSAAGLPPPDRPPVIDIDVTEAAVLAAALDQQV